MKTTLKQFIGDMLRPEKADKRAIIPWYTYGFYAGVRQVCSQLALVAGIGLCLPAMGAVKRQPVKPQPVLHQRLVDQPEVRVKCPSCSIEQTTQPWAIEAVGMTTTKTHLMLTRLLSFQCGHCDAVWTATKSKVLKELPDPATKKADMPPPLPLNGK